MAKILIAEDDAELAGLLADWLTFEKHEVVVAYDGRSAADAVSAGGLELLILDWELPGKKGIDICREHRSQGGELPIILLTAHVSIDNKTQGFDAGADDYLTKPFHMKELSGRIAALLRRSKPATFSIDFKSCVQCGVVFHNADVCPDDGGDLKEERLEIAGTGSLTEAYEIDSVIGRGSMSTVFLARQKATGRRVALKLMDSLSAEDPISIIRFQQEAKLLSKLHHPNIVGVHDFGNTSQSRPYIAMDYIDGLPLSRCINRKEEFPLQRSIALFKQIAMGVGHAHDRNIIHRDLKPANILLERFPHKERVNICDFGVAKIVEEQDETDENFKLTRSGEIFGTTMYMSPEQCMGREPDKRSDIYSLGCIMYEVISGSPPFSGRNVLETIHKQVHTAPPHLVSRTKDMPDILEKTVLKALAKDPVRRQQSMEEVLQSLERIK